MARGATPWTEAMEEFLADGEWHGMEEVLAVGAAVVPAERALEEMGKSKRAQQADEGRRIAAGQKTLAQQSLMGMKRFSKVEIKGNKPDQEVRKLSAASVSPGVLVERVAALEAQVARLFALLGESSESSTASEPEDRGDQLIEQAFGLERPVLSSETGNISGLETDSFDSDKDVVYGPDSSLGRGYMDELDSEFVRNDSK